MSFRDADTPARPGIGWARCSSTQAPGALFCLLALMMCLSPLGGANDPDREISLQQRVEAQRAIERVYYTHQAGATRPFEDAVTTALLERKVRAYLKQSVALAEVWQTPITSEMLDAEMGRIARDSRFPDRLREIYQALDNDAFLIEECFARPILADRLARSFFASDERIHAPAGTEARRLRDGRLDGALDASARVAGMSWDDWWAGAQERLDERHVRAVASPAHQFVQPVSRALGFDPSCEMDDTWDNGLLDDAPEGRGGGPAIWTGSVMIVWAASESHLTSLIYDPLTDTWRITSPLPSPELRGEATAVWTGREMIVWGGWGRYSLHSGGWRYDPAADSWASTSTVNAPTPRRWHSAVWTGSRMIVWGGATQYGGGNATNTGGQYDPETDTWTPTSLSGAPTPRDNHSAVWTGSQMIVWGGRINTGGLYDPVMDRWTSMSLVGAPRRPWSQIAVWTGGEMLVWGGDFDNNAVVHSLSGRYDPATNRWRPMTTVGEPEARLETAGVWTGSLMLVWGGQPAGFPGIYDTGGRYDPASDTWTPISEVNAPDARSKHPAIWTGSLMLVWGGSLNESGGGPLDGGRYDPVSDTWTPISNRSSGPQPRRGHSATWTGSRMIVWGGSGLANGGLYDPLTDSWTETAQAGAPQGRWSHAAVWTGQEMIVWGGIGAVNLSSGGRYDPLSDAWRPTSLLGAPPARAKPTAVWTGRRMLVWGGAVGISPVGSGGRYDPVADSWEPITGTGAPEPRSDHTAIWTGDEMIVWGGQVRRYTGTNDGGRYDSVVDVWRPLSTSDAPSPRFTHTAVWTGDEMIVWGGNNDACCGSFSTGGRYRPSTDTWSLIDTVTAPVRRKGHTAIWTGRFMLVWGGYTDSLARLNSGGRYDPVADSWEEISPVSAPSHRAEHTAVWTGREMIVWGGGYFGISLDTGGRYRVADNLDADEDGFKVCDGDCDDADATVHPGAVELPGNTADEDCDGALVCDSGASWRNHGQYVSCVSRACASLVEDELIEASRCAHLIGAAARTSIGRQDPIRP